MRPMSNSQCTMYLLRHGATDVNTAHPPRLQGRGMNLGLSDVGRRQAECAAEFFASRPLTAVYSSPLLRAQETAGLIAARHALSVHTIDELIEVDVGQWEGRAWVEIEQTEPEAYQRFMADPGAHGYAGGESFLDVQRRVAPAMAEVLAANDGGRILVVAHNIVNRAYLASLLNLPLAFSRMIHQDNCGINIVRLKDGETQLRTQNATFHLEGM